MMNTKVILTIGIALAAAVGGYFLIRRRGDDLASSLSELTMGCYNVPPNMKTYNEQDIQWGAFAKAIQDEIGNYDQNEPYVHGFLKGLNVEAHPEYVKYYKNEIKKHLAGSKKLPHWLVTAGMYRCDTPTA
jgi:hypothetical protein